MSSGKLAFWSKYSVRMDSIEGLWVDKGLLLMSVLTEIPSYPPPSTLYHKKCITRVYIIGTLHKRPTRSPAFLHINKDGSISISPPTLRLLPHRCPNHLRCRCRSQPPHRRNSLSHESPVSRIDCKVPGWGWTWDHGLGSKPASLGHFPVHQLPGTEEQLDPVLPEGSLVL